MPRPLQIIPVVPDGSVGTPQFFSRHIFVAQPHTLSQMPIRLNLRKQGRRQSLCDQPVKVIWTRYSGYLEWRQGRDAASLILQSLSRSETSELSNRHSSSPFCSSFLRACLPQHTISPPISSHRFGSNRMGCIITQNRFSIKTLLTISIVQEPYGP